jgi:hypothetical protein
MAAAFGSFRKTSFRKTVDSGEQNILLLVHGLSTVAFILVVAWVY